MEFKLDLHTDIFNNYAAAELSTNYWRNGVEPFGTSRLCVGLVRSGSDYVWRDFACAPRAANYFCETGIKCFLLFIF